MVKIMYDLISSICDNLRHLRTNQSHTMIIPIQHHTHVAVHGSRVVARRDFLKHSAALGLGLGKVAQPLRVAITGSAVSPSIEHTVYLAGRERALARIDRAIGRVRSRAAES